MATGDLKGNLCKMEQRLRLINYPTDVDYTGLAKGDPSVFLPIISYCFTSFSTYITELVMESGVELTAKNDSRFVDAIYKLLRDQFQYKPVLSKQQFLQHGFAERKIQIVCDIISYIYKRHKEFSNINKVKSQTEKRSHSVKSLAHASFPNQPDTVAISTVDLQQKPQVQRHKSVINMHIPEDFVSDTLKEVKDCVVNNVQVLDSGGDALDNIDDPVVKKENEVEVLKSQLAELQQKFHTLNSVEEKLETLEKKLQGKVVIEENEWNNLLSRVLLLETRLLLHSKTADISVEFNNMREEDTSSRNMTPVSSDKEKVELPESLHQSSGYSSLLSADPSPKAMAVNDNGVLEVSKETTIQKMERINKMIEETSELLKTSRNTSSEYSTPFSQITETNYVCP
ncbi:centrosomal protein of 44 kDa isoform X1 [Python bivittatus]|uniref:Centrosomal protein of 44 kDa n=1 Tax=Python bivittatus TaxID=176946 RepID=A0A9F5IWF7_PYTBI|nr:centrosomal protein of 44 kDa isoform X1 [Python bivittatus]XP_025024853.1 centrosomal protein of 44 kDa isoform X1 [Python bivittatus]